MENHSFSSTPRILITSGGTKVPIDPVRDITNKSRGTFGSKIAIDALEKGNEVFYFAAEECKTPFTFKKDFNTNIDAANQQFLFKLYLDWCQKHQKQYREARYNTYDEYSEGLFLAIKNFKPNIIILAAAVSDYVTVPFESKVRTASNLTIALTPAEKIISRVKKESQAILVGFKLLVDESKENLIQAAWDSIQKNGCDFVVANDYRSLALKKHEITIVESVNGEKKITDYKEDLASSVVDKAIYKYEMASIGR